MDYDIRIAFGESALDNLWKKEAVTLRRSIELTVVLACAIAASACSGASASSVLPTSPQGSSALRLASPPSLTLPGDAYRLSLVSTESNADVGTIATWASSSSEVAEVDKGTVRALSPGITEISASYVGSVAKTLIKVSALTPLDGVVLETSPTRTTPIGDALVSVIGGCFDARQARTDNDGRFHLADLAGAFRVRVSRAGFETIETAVDLDARDTLDVALESLAGSVTDVYAFSTGYQPGDPPLRTEDRFTFAVHTGGSIQIALNSWRTPYDGDFLDVELISGGTTLAHLRNCDSIGALVVATCTGSRLPEGLTVVSASPGTFVLKVGSERNLILAYHILVTHPR
jgi:hypothetical protein